MGGMAGFFLWYWVNRIGKLPWYHLEKAYVFPDVFPLFCLLSPTLEPQVMSKVSVKHGFQAVFTECQGAPQSGLKDFRVRGQGGSVVRAPVDTTLLYPEQWLFHLPYVLLPLLLSRFNRVSNSVWPHRRQPTRLPRPWDSPGKNTGVGCRFLLQCMKMKSESEVAQLCLTLSDPMDCSLPGSSVHGICQARVLKWVAIAFSALCPGALQMRFLGWA